MDLDRLKISETHTTKPSGKFSTGLVVFALLVFIAGFIAGRFLPFFSMGKKVRVETTVVRSTSSDRMKAFTAGGWIEVAHPRYPLFASSRLSEYITEVNVVEGQTVQSGTVIARLYDTDIKNELDISKAQMAAAKSELDKMLAGYRKEDISQAESAMLESREAVNETDAKVRVMREELRSAKAKLEEAVEQVRICRANLERGKSLLPNNISEQELDNLASKVTLAEAQLNQADAGISRLNASLEASLVEYEKAKARLASSQAMLQRMNSGYRVEEIAYAQAMYDEALSRVQLNERRLSYCKITAPDFAKPLRVLKVFASAGQWIDMKENSEIASFYDPLDIQVRVDVTQSSVGSVVPGAECIVTTEVNPRKEYKGTVLRIEPLAELSKNTITVRVRINDPDDRLFPEMVARIAFLAKGEGPRQPNALYVPTSAIGKDSAGEFVLQVVKGKAVKTIVTTGNSTGDMVQVTSGLTSGSRIVSNGLETINDGDQVEEK